MSDETERAGSLKESAISNEVKRLYLLFYRMRDGIPNKKRIQQDLCEKNFEEIRQNPQLHCHFLKHFERYLASDVIDGRNQERRKFQAILLAIQHLRRLGFVDQRGMKLATI